ncbi:MAG: hypothetical protein ACR2NN_08610 [Bryobacteraceae bacterium]
MVRPEWISVEQVPDLLAGGGCRDSPLEREPAGDLLHIFAKT